MVTGRPEKWPFIHSEAVLTTCSISSSADGIEAFAWSTQKSVDDSVHVFCAFLKDLCRLLLHCDSSAESCAPSCTDSPGGTGKGGRLALHFVTKILDSPHAPSLASQNVVAPGAASCCRTRAPGVPQRRDREPAARHALPHPGAGRGGECAWRSAALQHPCPCRPAGKGPGRAQYRVQTAVYVKRQSG